MTERHRGPRATAIAAFVMAVIGLPAIAVAAQISPPGGSEPPPAAMPACKGSRKVVCVPVSSPTQAATGLAELTSSAKVRRGLGLAPLRKLFGKRWAAKARGADAKFAKKASATRFASASSVGEFGGGDQLGQSLGANQALRNGRTRQTRSLRVEIAVDQCPDPGPVSNGLGSAKVQGRAKYVVSTTAQNGSLLITTIVTLELRVTAKALDNSHAELWGIPDFGGEDVGITRQMIVRNLRTHRTSHPPLLHTSVHLQSLDPAGEAELELESFNVWLERQEALNKGEAEPFTDLPLLAKDFKTAARAFTTYVGSRILEVTHEAEKNWKRPNACMKLTLNGPDKVAPSHSVQIFGKVATTSVPASEEQVLSRIDWEGNWINGGQTTTVAKAPVRPGVAWFDFKAPPFPWTAAKKPGVKVTVYSKAGVAQETKLYELGPPPNAEVDFNGTAKCAYGGIQCGEAELHFDWHGSAELEPGPAFPGLQTWSLKSGHLNVTITGQTEKCEFSGQGSVQMSPASIDTVSFALMDGEPQTYQLTINLGTETTEVTTENCEKEEEDGKTTQFPLGVIAYAKSPEPIKRPTPTGPISYSYSGQPSPGDPLYHFQWTISGFE